MWHQSAKFENSWPQFFSNLNNFHSLEVVDRVSETQLQVGENSDWIIWRLKGWPWKRWNIFGQTMETKGFFQFEIIINGLVSSFRFIWIPMLWVYGHSKYFYSYSTGIDFSRHNLPSTDVRFCRLKLIPCRRQILTTKVDPSAAW